MAVTIFDRRNRLESKTVQWAIDVLKLWENRPGDVSCLVINDGLHPTRIAEYAYSSLIKYTLE